MTPETQAQNPFSVFNPKIRLAWDPSSLSDWMHCPRYYDLTHNHGYEINKVDFVFGRIAASSFETFQKARLAGASHADAMLQGVRYAFEASWEPDGDPEETTGKPWGGYYETQWHCTGTTKYRNPKGNAAKCPYSHKGSWFPAPTPDICGECGSQVETERHYIPDDAYKNRETLLRLVTWYFLEQPEDMTDGLHAYKFPDGTAAVELSYAIPLDLKTPYGEQYVLAGYLDLIGVFGSEHWIVDQKSTKKSLNEQFFGGYSPHVQFDTYDLAGSTLYKDLNIKGVLIDAAQTLINGAKFARHPYRKTEGQREEHLASVTYWIKLAEAVAESYGAKGLDYPMNKTNCWKCPLKGICNLDPAERKSYLDANFGKRAERWNPLKPR